MGIRKVRATYKGERLEWLAWYTKTKGASRSGCHLRCRGACPVDRLEREKEVIKMEWRS